MSDRRELSFSRLDAVMPEVERLLAGHVTLGRWSLGQICNHLSRALRLTSEPSTGQAVRPGAEVFRRRFFESDRFPDGRSSPTFLEPTPGLDDRAEADSLREAIDRWAATTGPYPPHPMLGELTRDEWARFHCMHCAHHLGFVTPTDSR